MEVFHDIQYFFHTLFANQTWHAGNKMEVSSWENNQTIWVMADLQNMLDY